MDQSISTRLTIGLDEEGKEGEWGSGGGVDSGENLMCFLEILAAAAQSRMDAASDLAGMVRDDVTGQMRPAGAQVGRKPREDETGDTDDWL